MSTYRFPRAADSTFLRSPRSGRSTRLMALTGSRARGWILTRWSCCRRATRPRGSGDARAGHAHRWRAAGWAALHLVELRVLEARAHHGSGLRMERAPDAAHRRREGLDTSAKLRPALAAV